MEHMLSPHSTPSVTVPDPFMPLMPVRVTPDESSGNLMEALPQTGSQCNLKTGVLGCGASDVSIMLHTTVMFIQHLLGYISPPNNCSTSGMLCNIPQIPYIPGLTDPISFTQDYFYGPWILVFLPGAPLLWPFIHCSNNVGCWG